MLEIFSLLSLGLMLGLEHSLDADHVAAIATISSKSSSWKKALSIGIYWGFGHTIILLLAGIIILNLKAEIPQNIAQILEGIIGLMLIFLGIKNLHDFQNSQSHFSFWIGAVHGLAGSAALTLIILTTTKSKLLGILFIGIFGLGSILGMAAASLILQIPTAFMEKKFPQKCAQTAGGLSIIMGTVIIFKFLL